MNDVTLRELKIVVERAVRPVRATIARKRRMREELLGHLAAIFEEERQKAGDEQAALDQARRRFGDPRELTEQLQQAVPRRDRCQSILENMGYRPSESAWHLAAKHFLVMLLINSTYLPLWLLAHGNLRDPGLVETRRLGALVLVGAVLITALWNVIFSIVLAPLLNKIGPVLASRRWGRISLAVLGTLVVLCGLALPGFAGVAVVSILMAHQATEEWRYKQGWA